MKLRDCLDKGVTVKDYKTSKELKNDIEESLNSQPINKFSEKTLELLHDPATLVREYEDHPDARFADRQGNWMFVWKNNMIKIDDEYVKYDDLIPRLKQLLEKET